MKDSASNLAVSDTPPARGSLQLGDGGILGSSLAFAGIREKRHKFFFCEVWVEYGGYCSKDFCLARLPRPGPLAIELTLVGLYLFVWAHSVFLGFHLLHCKVWIMWDEKRTHHCVVSCIQRSLDYLPSSLCLSDKVFISCMCSGVLVVISRRDKKKKNIDSIFL